MYLFLNWMYSPSFILNHPTDGNIFNVFYNWRCCGTGHFWYDVAEVCVYRTKKPVEVQEMLLSWMNNQSAETWRHGQCCFYFAGATMQSVFDAVTPLHCFDWDVSSAPCCSFMASELWGLLGATGAVVLVDRSSRRPMMSSERQIEGEHCVVYPPSDWLLLQFYTRFSGPPLFQDRSQTRLLFLHLREWGSLGLLQCVKSVIPHQKNCLCRIEFNHTHTQAHNDHCWVLPPLYCGRTFNRLCFF